MIKTTLFIFSFLGLTTVALAQQNPQIRDCRIAGGQFTEIAVPRDQIGLCEFGHSYLGALDVHLFVSQVNESQSIQNYKDSIRTCSGDIIVGQILNTKINITVCQYPDGSFIDLKTLTHGSSDPGHAQLNQFLGL